MKLHFDLLHSQTWVMASDANRALMVALMLLASKYDNETPNNLAYIQRIASLNEPVDLSWLVAEGFIELVGDVDGTEVNEPVISKKKKRKRKAKTADRFDDFWAVYPNKRNKKRARQIWINHNLDNMADRIIADVVRRAKHDTQWVKDEGQYIPHPSTYLNGERWEDALKSRGRKHSEDLPDLDPDRRW